mmetsp:Transcript_33657/g.44405  ORF Transcript_33657/g.44405 Transcript_33657/m.44405 type:complete len:260 (-) Transcript_33657:701-1480(-)
MACCSLFWNERNHDRRCHPPTPWKCCVDADAGCESLHASASRPPPRNHLGSAPSPLFDSSSIEICPPPRRDCDLPDGFSSVQITTLVHPPEIGWTPVSCATFPSLGLPRDHGTGGRKPCGGRGYAQNAALTCGVPLHFLLAHDASFAYGVPPRSLCVAVPPSAFFSFSFSSFLPLPLPHRLHPRRMNCCRRCCYCYRCHCCCRCYFHWNWNWNWTPFLSSFCACLLLFPSVSSCCAENRHRLLVDQSARLLQLQQLWDL